MTRRCVPRPRGRTRRLAPVILPVLFGLAAPARAPAQVALEGELREVTLDGRSMLLARVPVRNGTAFTWRVEVGRIYAQMPNDSAVVLGPEVVARVSPRVFSLAPGERQIIGVTFDALTVRSATYRLEVTVSDGQPIQAGETGAVRTVLLMATRYLVKLTRRTA
jgi:hypothetical protein